METSEWVARAAIWYSGYMHGSFDTAKREVPGFDKDTLLEFEHEKVMKGWMEFINSDGDIGSEANASALLAMTVVLNEVVEIVDLGMERN